MALVDALLDANLSYVPSHREIRSPRPTERLAVVTCMDARIDALGVLGLDLGGPSVIRGR